MVRYKHFIGYFTMFPLLVSAIFELLLWRTLQWFILSSTGLSNSWKTKKKSSILKWSGAQKYREAGKVCQSFSYSALGLQDEMYTSQTLPKKVPHVLLYNNLDWQVIDLSNLWSLTEHCKNVTLYSTSKNTIKNV